MCSCASDPAAAFLLKRAYSSPTSRAQRDIEFPTRSGTCSNHQGSLDFPSQTGLNNEKQDSFFAKTNRDPTVFLAAFILIFRFH